MNNSILPNFAHVSKAEETLIVIPDISGFSSFVNEVAISHSEHIIRELLEIVIDSNDLQLKVSEIEGDAVLFYKVGDFPSSRQLLETLARMFVRFHEHLQLYKHNRICQCGACQTAHQLSLKVIVDQGYASAMQVKKHQKLVGPSLIAAHRLLKNEVPSDEYVLLSDRYINCGQSVPDGDSVDWANWQYLKQEFEGIGEVGYYYALLSPLKKRVRAPEERRTDFSVKHPLVLRQEIAVNYQDVYQVITDSKQKENWVKGIDQVIRQTSEEIERIGSKHLCVVNGQELQFENIHKESREGELEFVEALQQFGPLREVAMVYRCRKLSESRTLLIVEVHYSVKPLMRPLMRIMMEFAKWDLKKSLRNLKRYLEVPSRE